MSHNPPADTCLNILGLDSYGTGLWMVNNCEDNQKFLTNSKSIHMCLLLSEHVHKGTFDICHDPIPTIYFPLARIFNNSCVTFNVPYHMVWLPTDRVTSKVVIKRKLVKFEHLFSDNDEYVKKIRGGIKAIDDTKFQSITTYLFKELGLGTMFIPDDIKDVYNIVKLHVAKLLQGVRGRIHVAQDGWAAPQKLSLLRLVVIWVADAKVQLTNDSDSDDLLSDYFKKRCCNNGEDVLEKYLCDPVLEDLNNPLHYWMSLLDPCDRSGKVITVTLKGALAQIALDFLLVPATSTDVEHLFSHSGLNIMKQHHNLSAESTIDQTVLNSWIKHPGLVDDDELTEFFSNKSKRPNNGGRKLMTEND
ncbi:uncharacterized protein ARMOST_00598 [Armillaria ostoyae]|uniref:HAT C-terminal dimerisation domain-containing protein n=1 Tax=Armillaria ostoyae TaxID=47428 RepID=A0A284QLL3_ARMOS|nr:uncharacterized protein ARMOST_00598 [Armillaria ostoyae]